MINDDACDEMERQIEIAPKSHERRELYQKRQETSKKNETKPKEKEMSTRKKQSRIKQKNSILPSNEPNYFRAGGDMHFPKKKGRYKLEGMNSSLRWRRCFG